uniref:Uncharacterized protein n=1 Tax=Ursus americanus TaxID=9643 RepID=A0A452SE82_URSAM
TNKTLVNSQRVKRAFGCIIFKAACNYLSLLTFLLLIDFTVPFFPVPSSRIIKTQFPGELLPPPPPPSITSRANIRHWINPKKESIHSIQGSIVSPHTAATNGGYSRKNDGGFFST